jgi:hypothetical protein
LDATLPRKPPNTQWRALQTGLDNYIFVPLLEANRPHVPAFKSWLMEVRCERSQSEARDSLQLMNYRARN